MQKETIWRPKENLTNLSVEEKVRTIRQRQIDIIRPVLESNYPKLYINEEAAELEYFIYDI